MSMISGRSAPQRAEQISASLQAHRSQHLGPHENDRILVKEECERIIARVKALAQGGGEISVSVGGWWNGELRWARNRVSLAGDRRDISVGIQRRFSGGIGTAQTNQLDDVSLEALVRVAERRAREQEDKHRLVSANELLFRPSLESPMPTIWSNATYAATAEMRSKLARTLTEEAENKGMLSAGYLEVRAGVLASSMRDDATKDFGSRTDMIRFEQWTQAQCSMTVRHPRGIGSGWAGLSSYDWAQIKGDVLARRALEKCLASLDPVRIEPGRYTVILEPQAVCDLLEVMMIGSDVLGSLARKVNENVRGAGPFSLEVDETLRIRRTKLGLQVMDERITISHDPTDPLLGVLSRGGLKPLVWIERGTLQELHHSHEYAAEELKENGGALYRPAFRMSGGPASMPDMLETTKRGILVTRFSGMQILDHLSLLSTGLTRDGLWLIENGRVTKAIHNMRFTESPLFVFNQVEQLGIPVPVFRPVRDPGDSRLTPAIVPPVKSRDFSFTALADAI